MPVGVDEAGRGPVMGPLVICAVHVPDKEPLLEMKVADSKVISRKRRDILNDELVKFVSWSVMVIDASEIDEARDRMTMNRLEVLGFSSVIASLLNRKASVHPELPDDISVSFELVSEITGPIVVDAADVSESRFGEELRSEVERISDPEGLDIISKHKADRDDPVVGAASILAKVTRDRKIDEISNELGVPVGSGYPSDVNTRSFISRWVREKKDLPPHCRRSWETARKLLGSNLQPDLFSFG